MFSERAHEIKYLDTTPLAGTVPNAAATTQSHVERWEHIGNAPPGRTTKYFADREAGPGRVNPRDPVFANLETRRAYVLWPRLPISTGLRFGMNPRAEPVPPSLATALAVRIERAGLASA